MLKDGAILSSSVVKGARRPAVEGFGPVLCDAPEPDGEENCRHCGLGTRKLSRAGGALSFVQHREVLLASISATSWVFFRRDGNRVVLAKLFCPAKFLDAGFRLSRR